MDNNRDLLPSGMNLAIRVDAGTHIGIGHVMRCLALAQVCRKAGGWITFVMSREAPVIEKRLKSEGMEVCHLPVRIGSAHDALETARFAKNTGTKWVIADGYNFDAKFQRILKESGLNLLFLDDYGHAEHYYADIVLNQNIYAGEKFYMNREPDTQLLLGSRYVLLRHEFLKWQGFKRKIREATDQILVTLGGSDPDNVSLKVIRAIKQIEANNFEVTIIVGPVNPYGGKIEKEFRDTSYTFQLRHAVKDMSNIFARADLAVLAGGTTCWESAFMGVPGLVLVMTGNQCGIAEWTDRAGAMINLGWFHQISESEIAEVLRDLLNASEKRSRMSQAGRMLVDGDGAIRVLHAISNRSNKTTGKQNGLKIRSASMLDTVFLWELANDPVGRMNAFDSRPISLDRHLEWYQNKLSSPNTRIWIIELNENPVAQVRYDRIESDRAKIDFAVLPILRKKGIGTKALTLTCRSACEELGVKELIGVVFESNFSSSRSFLKAGFKQSETTRSSRGRPCLTFEWIYPGEI